MLQPSLLKIEELKNPKTPLPSSKLIFGKTFTDHMLMIPWSSESGWAEPVIKECESTCLRLWRSCPECLLQTVRSRLTLRRLSSITHSVCTSSQSAGLLSRLLTYVRFAGSKA